MRRPFLSLTLGRLGLFLLCALVIRLVSVAVDHRLNGLSLLLLALLVSSPLGYWLFTPQRHAAAEVLEAHRHAKEEAAAERRSRIENES